MLHVIGLGNRLRGDDAVGPCIIEYLQNSGSFNDIKLLDAGTDAFSLLLYLTGKDPVIIVDCAKMGRQAGEVIQYDMSESQPHVTADMLLLHGFSFPELFKIAKALGEVAPCKIICIEPKHLTFNQDISSEVKASIPEIVNIIKTEARYYAQKDINN